MPAIREEEGATQGGGIQYNEDVDEEGKAEKGGARGASDDRGAEMKAQNDCFCV